MYFKITRYILLFFATTLVVTSCTKQEKNENGIVKVNNDGIPVMLPLQEVMPKLSNSYIKEKKYEVSRYFEKTWSEKNDNVAFLVAKNGQIIYENYMGFANRSTDVSITKDTPLHIASVSKVLTSTAILMLVDTKRLSLNQKVNTIITNFPYPDVTIQTLLNHRSGMKNYSYFTYENNNWDKKLTLRGAA